MVIFATLRKSDEVILAMGKFYQKIVCYLGINLVPPIGEFLGGGTFCFAVF